MSALRKVRIKSPFHGRAAGKQRSRGFVLGVGFIAFGFAVFMFYVGYHAPQSVPLRSYYNLHAIFKTADNLEDHYEVRIGGVRAGQVLNPRVHNHLAEIDLQLGSTFKPLRSDSRLEIRLRSAVGVRYVNIVPGTSGTPLPDGATIPVSQTSAPVDLDQVLRTFDPQTQVHFRDFLGELGTGLAGRGQDVNQLLRDVPGFLSSVGSVSQAINARPGAMRAFISAAQGTTAAFDPVRNELANGFQPEAQAMFAFANQRGNVQATLDQAPPTLLELQSGLPPVTALVSQVQGLALAATPTLAVAPAALNETTALLQDAQPGLRNADATLKLAHKAVSPALKFLTTAKTALPDLNKALADALPIVTYVGPRACGLTDAMSGWAGVMRYGTAYDNFIRFTITPSGSILAGQAPLPGRGVLVPSTPYPGPCVGRVGEWGGTPPTAEQLQSPNPIIHP
jgi:ABC-type transporter Mla subunit MlaD